MNSQIGTLLAFKKLQVVTSIQCSRGIYHSRVQFKSLCDHINQFGKVNNCINDEIDKGATILSV